MKHFSKLWDEYKKTIPETVEESQRLEGHMGFLAGCISTFSYMISEVQTPGNTAVDVAMLFAELGKETDEIISFMISQTPKKSA